MAHVKRPGTTNSELRLHAKTTKAAFSLAEPAGGAYDTMENFRNLVRQKLSNGSIRTLAPEGRARAAVLVSIFEQRRHPCFLLTLRTQHVATHKGEVSFPGGMFDKQDDSLRATALRETSEELGIPPTQVDILGRFHDCTSINNYVVTPFVGFIEPGFRLAPNPREVEEVLKVPLDFFRSALPRCEVRRRQEKDVCLYFYDYGEYVIWGLTARIIKDFLEFLKI
ncbi:MAG: CoA pyrophosphatase [Acidobacteria bacterium]|nr:CoA pyrophosphatase [Acidobacteriota bacterium]